MNHEEILESLIEARKSKPLVDFLISISPTERRNLASCLRQILKEVYSEESWKIRTRIWHSKLSEDQKREKIKRWDTIHQCCYLASLAIFTWTEISRLGWERHEDPKSPETIRLLVSLQPDWVQKYVDYLLKNRFLPWATVRDYMKTGLIKKPQVEEYLHRFMVFGVKAFTNASREKGEFELGPLPAIFHEEPDILAEDIWKLFEVEGTQEISLANLDKYSGSLWDKALKALSEQGLIDRQRLLLASLEALSRDFMQYRANWFARFHEFLEPDLQERKELLENYYLLLNSRNYTTVSFALKALRVLSQAGELDYDLLISSLEPVFMAEKKVIINLGLALLRDTVKKRPDRAVQAAIAALPALLLPAPDIQKKVLGLLKKVPEGEQVLAQELMSYTDTISPSLKKDFTAWLAKHSPNSDGETNPLETDASEEENDEYKAPPILDPANRLKSIETWEELLFCGTRLIESFDSITQFELFLDGFCRLVPGNLELAKEQLKPLIARAEKLQYDSKIHKYILLFIESLNQDQTGIDWLSTAPQFREYDDGKGGIIKHEVEVLPEHPALIFFHRRLRELRDRILAGPRIPPLLSIPTHSPHWIDPEILIDRIEAYQKNKWPPDELDLNLALARTAPGNRANALVKAKEINDETGRVIRYALGGKAEPPFNQLSSWITAGRVAHPGEELKEFQGKDIDGPNTISPAVYTISYEIERNNSSGYVWTTRYAHVTTKPLVIAGSFSLFIHKEQHHAPLEKKRFWSSGRDFEGSPIAALWQQAMTPSLVDPMFSWAVEMISSTICDTEVGDHWIRTYCEIMMDPHVKPGPMHTAALVTAMSSSDKVIRDLATEAIIVQVDQNRIDVPAFGWRLGEQLNVNFARLNRITPNLRIITETSPQHRLVVRNMIFDALAEIQDGLPDQLPKFLEFFYETCLACGKTDFPKPRKSLFSEDLVLKGKARTFCRKIEKEILAVQQA